MNYQESGIVNLQKITSNPGPLLPKQTLWLNNHAMDNGDVKFHTSDFPVEFNCESDIDWDTTHIKSIYDDEMDHFLWFFHLEHDNNIMDDDIHMRQAWLVAASPSKFYTFSTVLLHKYEGANVAVTNYMLHFSMFVPIKATVKLSNANTGYA